MPTFDEFGNIIPDPEQSAVPVGSEGTFGAAVWAFFHPGQVQTEYEATGKPVPSKVEIMSGAATDIETQAADAVTTGFRDIARTGQVIAIAAVALAAVYIFRELTKGR